MAKAKELRVAMTELSNCVDEFETESSSNPSSLIQKLRQVFMKHGIVTWVNTKTDNDDNKVSPKKGNSSKRISNEPLAVVDDDEMTPPCSLMKENNLVPPKITVQEPTPVKESENDEQVNEPESPPLASTSHQETENAVVETLELISQPKIKKRAPKGTKKVIQPPIKEKSARISARSKAIAKSTAIKKSSSPDMIKRYSKNVKLSPDIITSLSKIVQPSSSAKKIVVPLPRPVKPVSVLVPLKPLALASTPIPLPNKSSIKATRRRLSNGKGFVDSTKKLTNGKVVTKASVTKPTGRMANGQGGRGYSTTAIRQLTNPKMVKNSTIIPLKPFKMLANGDIVSNSAKPIKRLANANGGTNSTNVKPTKRVYNRKVATTAVVVKQPTKRKTKSLDNGPPAKKSLNSDLEQFNFPRQKTPAQRKAIQEGRPLGKRSAYAFFVQLCMEELKKQNPGEFIDFPEFSRQCAERWKTMTDREKRSFHEMAKRDLERYEAQYEIYLERIARGEISAPFVVTAKGRPKKGKRPQIVDA